MAAYETPSLDRLQSMHDSILLPVESLDDEIDHAIAENSNSIAVDMLTAVIVRAKTPAEALFGYEPGELKGKSIHDLVPANVRDLHRTWFDQYRLAPTSRAMGSRGMKLVGVKKDGREFPVEIGLCAAEVGGLRLAIATVIPMVTRGKEGEYPAASGDTKGGTHVIKGTIELTPTESEGDQPEKDRS